MTLHFSQIFFTLGRTFMVLCFLGALSGTATLVGSPVRLLVATRRGDSSWRLLVATTCTDYL
jgi:hypothetical protein